MDTDRIAGPVLCFGEVLWDALPAGLFLGGAPFNVACHLHTLGVPVSFAGRVGNDRLGSEIRRRLLARGMDTTLLQVDSELQSGFVEVSLDDLGTPTFEIVEPAAWDQVSYTPSLAKSTSAASAIVFGSLSQRAPRTRGTLREMWESAAVKVFDVNMRPPFVDRDIIFDSLKAAELVKLNEDELRIIADWLDWPGSPEESMETMARVFGVSIVCVTRGARGATIWHEGRHFSNPGYHVRVVDTVGAGDAFLAGLLNQLQNGSAPDTMLDFAARLGAFVATRQGATPDYSRSDLFGVEIRAR